MIQAMIERFAQGAGVPLAAIEGLSREEMLALPVPGTWSIQQIVVHLLDSDLVATDRMKRVIAEEKPLLVGFNETKFAERLHYDALDVRQAAEMFRLNRELMATILRKLPEADFARQGVHTESGLKSLLDLVQIYSGHLDDHMVHLRHKRALLGKPLAANS